MTEPSAPTRLRRRVAFANLGCRLNIAESDALAARFVAAGYDVSGFAGDLAEARDAGVDAVVVNTCTVTAEADRKSRNLTRRAGRAAGPVAAGGGARPVVVATGCFATGSPEVAASMPGVDYVVDNDRKAGIFDLVQAHLSGEIVQPDQLPADPFGYQAGPQPLHTRATIKIQDGCDNNCTFCIIPQVRGRASSRAPDAILAEAQHLLAQGHRELVVTGVNIGRYQARDLDFAALLEQLLQLPGDYRVRLSSLEPDPLGDRFLALVGHRRLCPHFHLCLQSGSDRILLRMRREYAVDEYLRLAAAIADEVRGSRGVPPQLTTDIMVGFPGETDADFAHTVAVCEQVGFGHIHTFRFSPRQGTRAARMPEAVADGVARQRSRQLRRVADRLTVDYRRSLIGHRQELLVERRSVEGDGTTLLSGYGECYVPITAVGADYERSTGVEPGDVTPVEVAELRKDGSLGGSLHGSLDTTSARSGRRLARSA